MSRSSKLLERALKVIPGGVNNPVRAFQAVGGDPPFMARGEGNQLIDEEGHRYIDLVCSWGALVLGHADARVLGAVTAATAKGSSFGAPTAGEVELAERLVTLVPSIEMVRLVNSGTEASIGALRLARGATGRDLVVKMEGCYHGDLDGLLCAAGSGAATFNAPSSPGVPGPVIECTLVAPYNDAEAVGALFERHADRIAAVIVEPVAANMGCVPPQPGYLAALRELCDANGALLIFDEVISGARVKKGTAQALYEVTPDLTLLGRIIGGGFPLAAFGGRAEIMRQLVPTGNIYQAEALAGHPVAVAAGLATIEQLSPDVFNRAEEVGNRVERGLQDAVAYHGNVSFSRVGSMFTVFFRSQAPSNYAQVQECDLDCYSRFFRACLANGIYMPPSQFEAAFLSPRLSDREVEQVVDGLSAAIVAAEL